MITKKVGNAIVVLSLQNTYANVHVTAPTSIVVSIYDPEGADVVTDQTMTLLTSGKYKDYFIYVWQSDESSVIGTYSATIKSVYSGYNAITDYLNAFELEA